MTRSERDGLPQGFQDLDKFRDKWDLPTELERNRARRSSTMAELEDFYNAVAPRLEAIIDYLDPMPLDRMPEDAKRLLHITLSLMEIAHAVELYHRPDLPNAFAADRVEFLVNDPA